MKPRGAPFRDRRHAAEVLAGELKGRRLRDPLVLGIPRGGVVLAAVLARELGAEFDVVLARKIRAPYQPEYALGAISEDGRVTLGVDVQDVPGVTEEYLDEEVREQLAEIDRRKRLIRAIRPAAVVADRSVIVTDDGIATGATMIAALQATRQQHPRELIVAVPVASPERLAEVSRWCDDAVCLHAPDDFHAVGQFYDQFDPVEDEEVLELLRAARSEPEA
jgi:predicted phosphoribosyltransferase